MKNIEIFNKLALQQLKSENPDFNENDFSCKLQLQFRILKLLEDSREKRGIFSNEYKNVLKEALKC